MLEDIVPIVTRTLGEDHARMSMTQGNLARAYALAHLWDKAAPVLEKLTQAFVPEHPGRLHAMCGLIHVKFQLGHLEDVERVCGQVLDMAEGGKALILDDPRALATAQVLLQIYNRGNRLEDVTRLKSKMPAVTDVEGGDEAMFKVLYGRRENQVRGRKSSALIW